MKWKTFYEMPYMCISASRFLKNTVFRAGEILLYCGVRVFLKRTKFRCSPLDVENQWLQWREIVLPDGFWGALRFFFLSFRHFFECFVTKHYVSQRLVLRGGWGSDAERKSPRTYSICDFSRFSLHIVNKPMRENRLFVVAFG